MRVLLVWSMLRHCKANDYDTDYDAETTVMTIRTRCFMSEESARERLAAVTCTPTIFDRFPLSIMRDEDPSADGAEGQTRWIMSASAYAAATVVALERLSEQVNHKLAHFLSTSA